MSKTRIFEKIRNFFIIYVGSLILKLWFSTCSIRIIGREYHDNYILAHQKMVGATWHRGAVFLVWFFRKAHPMIMFSRSKDGELLAGFAEKIGIIPIRGSSGNGGREALDGMLAHLNAPGNNKAATVLDGPTGPPYVAKKGMIVLAKNTGIPLLPIMVSATPALTFSKAWDKAILPLPFSKVIVSYRKPWEVPADISEEELELLRGEVETTLNEMRIELDQETGYTGG